MDISLDFEGRPIAARDGEPVAVALHRAGERILGRSVKYHRPRGAPCLAGHCGSCLVRIDGVPSRLACQVVARDGMTITRQNAFPSASIDMLRAADFLFPGTFNHHQLLTSVPKIQGLMANATRVLAGLGELPDAAGDPFEAAEELRCRTLLVGVGRTGRSQLATLGDSDLAIDARAFMGNERVWPSAIALGIYFEREEPVVAVRRANRLTRVRPERLTLCTGSRAQIPPFPGCDLPGVMTDEAATLLAHHGVSAGEQVVSFNGDEIQRLRRAEGRRGVKRVVRSRADGVEEVIAADALVIGGFRAPAFELGEQAGAQTTFVAGRGHAIQCDEHGRTRVPWLSAFGSCATKAAD